MLDMDVTKQPRRISEWDAVLHAVVNADDNDEQTWLEWKSTLDLRSKEQMATVVAKAIIAMANREPDKAAARVGGIGILLIGIEPGTVHGVKPVDNADLDKLITPYVGADGPVWSPHWTRFQGRTVLIIEVAAPQWGDPIHCFHKEAPGVPDGAVFVRKLAQSTRANHLDIARLGDRRAARIPDTFDVTVSVESARPLSRYGWRPEHLERFLVMQKQEMMKPLMAVREQRTRSAPVDTLISKIIAQDGRGVYGLGLSGLSGKIAEDRSEKQYEAEVDAYLDAIRSKWPAIVRRAAVHVLTSASFVLRNNSTRNYQDVLVELHVAGIAEAAETDTDAKGFDLFAQLPKRPRAWGPRDNPAMKIAVPNWQASTFVASRPQLPPPFTITNGGSFTLAFAPVALRPQQRQVLADNVCLLIPTTRTEPVTATWTATATNADGPPATGSFTIDLHGEGLDVLAAALPPRRHR
ncbi:RNA-binding domain-containing protein [Actinoplanes sp. DH11]|uniref:RNA-binding domain-containing protein n=1 Tax=Actinoplanes sp. DH11 TaxID=2857011 RepID=UPI001E2D3630|nr:RNA-binding domain-containing protein [Actinoplanes sp. DH11]